MYDKLVSEKEAEEFARIQESMWTQTRRLPINPSDSSGILTPAEWHAQICSDNVTLMDLAQSGKVDQYHMVLGIIGLSYLDYLIKDPMSGLLPIVRHVMPSLIASDIVGVQPMQVPTSEIFTLRHRYTSRWERLKENIKGLLRWQQN